MKKYYITSAFLLFTLIANAQVKIGLTVSPGFSDSRLRNYEDSVSTGSAVFRAKFGLEFDFPFADNYAFSTGLIFAPKMVRLTSNGPNNPGTQEYKIQYVQLPATLKLYTNEVLPDMRVYFQLGFLAEILVFQEPVEEEYTWVKDFRFFDIAFTGGAGVEYGAGVNTIIYGGIFYDRGLINVVSKQGPDTAGGMSARTSFFSLKVGLKF